MPERILLYRPGFLGDVVMSMPAVRLVRQHNPDAHIFYSTNPPCDQLLAACPWIDDVRRAGQYRHSDYDRICHFSHEDFWPQSEYWGALHVKNVQQVGLAPEAAQVDLEPTIWLDPVDKPENPRLHDLGLYIVVHAHSTNGRNWRLWDMGKWDQLVRRIMADTPYGVVQLGMADDPAIPACAEAGTDFRGQHSVMEDVWTVAKAFMCVCIDSFIAHVAHARKVVAGGWLVRNAVRTVLLNGPIRSECLVPPNAKCVVVSDYSHCRRGGPCGHSHGAQMCESKNACMRELSVDAVWAGVQEALHGVHS
jgi:hypothetical protein